MSSALAKATDGVTWASEQFLGLPVLLTICLHVRACVANGYRLFSSTDTSFEWHSFGAVWWILFLGNSEPRSSVWPTKMWRPEKNCQCVSGEPTACIKWSNTSVFLSDYFLLVVLVFYMSYLLFCLVYEDNTYSLDYLMSRIDRDDESRMLWPVRTREPQDSCELGYRLVLL